MGWECTNPNSWIEIDVQGHSFPIEQNNDWTASIWFKLTSPIIDDDQVFVSMGNDATPGRRAGQAQIVPAADNPNAAKPGAGLRYRTSAGPSIYGGSSVQPSEGVWQHALITSDNQGQLGSHFMRVIFEAGTEDATAHGGSNPDVCWQCRYFNEADVALGTDGGKTFLGRMADVAVWDGLPSDRDAMAAAIRTGNQQGRYADDPAVTAFMGGADPVIYNKMESAPADWNSIPNEGTHTATNWSRVGTNVNHVADHPNLAGGVPAVDWGEPVAWEVVEWDIPVQAPVQLDVDLVFYVAGLTGTINELIDDGLSTTCTWDHPILPDVVITGLVFDGFRETDGASRWRARFNPQFLGVYTLTTSGSTEPLLNGLTGAITAVSALPGFRGRGHFIKAPGQAQFEYMNGDVIAPNVVLFPSPATELSDPGPPAVNWPGFWIHDPGDDPELGDVNYVLMDQLLDEFVGPNSNHQFLGVDTLVHGGWFGDGRVTPSNFGWPNTDEDISLQCFRALEALIRRVHDRGGVTIVLRGPDESDGNESNLPGGYNGTEAVRLQNYIWARLGPVCGWIDSYGYDCWEFAGEGFPPTHPYNIENIFDAYAANAAVRTPYFVPLTIRNYNGDLTVGYGNTDVRSLELYKPGATVTRGTQTNHFGYNGILNYEPLDDAVGQKPTLADDRLRVRPQSTTGKDYSGTETSLLLPHSYVAGGCTGGALGDLTDDPAGVGGPPLQKEYRAFGNSGNAPSNKYDNPNDYPTTAANERLRIAKLNAFHYWNNPANGNTLPRTGKGTVFLGPPFTDYMVTGPTSETGTTCLKLGDRNFSFYVENSGSMTFDLVAMGMTGEASIGGIAVRFDQDAEPFGTFLEVVVNRAEGGYTFPTIGNWALHLGDDYAIEREDAATSAMAHQVITSPVVKKEVSADVAAMAHSVLTSPTSTKASDTQGEMGMRVVVSRQLTAPRAPDIARMAMMVSASTSGIDAEAVTAGMAHRVLTAPEVPPPVPIALAAFARMGLSSVTSEVGTFPEACSVSMGHRIPPTGVVPFNLSASFSHLSRTSFKGRSQ